MQVAKWGNSLAVRLPRKLVDELKLAPGDEIEIVGAQGHRLEIAKLDRRAAFLKRIEKYNWPAPEGFKFDRDEAHER